MQRVRGEGIEAILVRKVGGSFIVNIIGTAGALGLQVLLARTMGATNFGQYIYVSTWVNLLVYFGKFGFDTASLRFLPEYYSTNQWNLLRGFVSGSTRVVIVMSVFLGIGSICFVWVFRDCMEPGVSVVFYISSALLPLSAYLILQCSFLQAFRHVVASSASQVIIRTLLMGLTIIVLAWGFRIEVLAQYAMLANVLTTALTILIVAALMRSILPREYFLGERQQKHVAWFKVAFPMLLITFFDMVLNQADIILVGSLLNTRESGVYSAASRLSTIVPYAILLVNIILAPLIAQLYAEKKFTQLQHMMTRVAWGSLTASVPLFIGIIVGSRSLLGLFGSEFQSGSNVLIILAFGRLFIALTGSSGYLMSMSGFQTKAALILGIAAVLNVVLNVILIPYFGIEGAAVSYSIPAAMWCIAMTVSGYRLTGINPTVFSSIKKLRMYSEFK